MNVGLLWADHSERELEAKVSEATEAYREKAGRKPNRCHVHPSMVGASEEDETIVLGQGITIVPDGSVLPGELWIGVHGKESGAPAGLPRA